MVYGASHNTPDEQYAFACKYALAIPLLSDPERAYRQRLGNPDGEAPAARITYVIDAQGIVRAVIGVPRVDAAEHPRLALAAVRALAGD